MSIPKKDFFTNNEVLFLGFSSNPNAFSRKVYQTFIKNGIKVYAVNTKKTKDQEIKVYTNLNELSQMPKCAYILLNKENTAIAAKQLQEKGIERILFHSPQTVDVDVVEQCRRLGIRVAVACPMMILKSGPIHKIHGFCAGLSK